LVAYLLGSIPTGYLLMRFVRHEDIRAVGSGNIGATNVLRSGGKILGAGGGGFLLLYVRRDRQAEVKAALKELRHIPFRFEREGSKIIFYNPTTLDPEREERESEEQEREMRSGL